MATSERPATSEAGAAEPAALALGRSVRRSAGMVARRHLCEPVDRVGWRLDFGDGTGAEVYRETRLEAIEPVRPAVLVVAFRLRFVHHRLGHAAFRLESRANTVFFAGFPGFVSKLWLRHDEQGRYRGLYEWDGPERAEAYVAALWRLLALASEPSSMRHALLPGLRRDALLADPELAGAVALAEPLVPPEGAPGWWRLVRARPPAP